MIVVCLTSIVCQAKCSVASLFMVFLKRILLQSNLGVWAENKTEVYNLIWGYLLSFCGVVSVTKFLIILVGFRLGADVTILQNLDDL